MDKTTKPYQAFVCGGLVGILLGLMYIWIRFGNCLHYYEMVFVLVIIGYCVGLLVSKLINKGVK